MVNIDKKIIIKVRFEEKDILHIYKMNSKRQFQKKMTFGKSLTGIFAGVLLLLTLIYTLINHLTTSTLESPDTSLSSYSLLPYVIFAVVIICIAFLLPKKLKKDTVNNFKSNKELQNEIEYSISEEGVFGHSITTDFHHDWSYFTKAVETNDVFALYLSNNTVICLPKRCFINENDIANIKKLIKEKFPGEKYQYLKIK